MRGICTERYCFGSLDDAMTRYRRVSESHRVNIRAGASVQVLTGLNGHTMHACLNECAYTHTYL
jgi:hypothetical protein